MLQPSPKLNRITELKDIERYTQRIYKAYESLLSEYEQLSKENNDLKKNASIPSDYDSPVTVTKRRKNYENEINMSRQSNDILNDAYRDISSCIEDDIIESTPKPDVSKKNVSKKISFFKQQNKSHFEIPINKIKLECTDDSLEVVPKSPNATIQSDKKPESPLRSLENQCHAGKENNSNVSKWISNQFISPSRVSRSGMTMKNAKAGLRLSLSKSFKQTTLDLAKKPVRKALVDSCAETFFEATPPIQITDMRHKYLRQQCLESCVTSSKDRDDDKIFKFESISKPQKPPSNSPPNIKLEPLTGKISPTNPSGVETGPNKIEEELNESCGSSVIPLSCESAEVIVIHESEPLFDDCMSPSENIELKMQNFEPIANASEKCNERIVDCHILLCRQCKVFINSCRHLTLEQKLNMIDRCERKIQVRPDTDPEYWNPRFVDTPESQRQETLIDYRFATSEKK